MNAAVIHNFGQAPRWEQFPDPVAGADETIVHVRAAALKPVDRQLASGSHYGSSSLQLPFICGIDGAGRVPGADGSRVLFAMPRAPYGAMAERTVVPKSRCFPIPDSVDDYTAAAVFNPGLSAWMSLTWRAKLVAGESVLILGATGVTGQLAVQTAKLLGAKRVIAIGRNEEVLRTLPSLGADETIRLADGFHACGRIDVIVDYLWGSPTEALIAAITRKDLLAASASSIRLVQAGESAGATITLPAAALRSSALEILGAGTGNIPPPEMWIAARQQLMSNVASGKLRIATERVNFSNISDAWQRDSPGRRVVMTLDNPQ